VVVREERVEQAARLCVWSVPGPCQMTNSPISLSPAVASLKPPSSCAAHRADPVPEHERLFRIFKDDAVHMNVDNTNNKALAQQELAKISGQLRYLRSLARTTTDASAAAAALGTTLGAAMAGARGGGGAGEDGAGAAASRVEGLCPVCQEEYGQQTDIAVMTCGHMLCARCMAKLEDHIHASTAIHNVRALHPGVRKTDRDGWTLLTRWFLLLNSGQVGGPSTLSTPNSLCSYLPPESELSSQA